MKFPSAQFIVYLVAAVIVSAAVVSAFEDDALSFERDNFRSIESNEMSSEMSSERGLISKMIERGKLLVKSLPRTLKLAGGRVLNWVPKPETIFNVGKQALIGLPQEAIAYAVNKVCKCLKAISDENPSWKINTEEEKKKNVRDKSFSTVWPLNWFIITGSAALHLNAIKPNITPSVHLMNFQFLTRHGDNFLIPLLQPHKLWDNPKFNRNWNTTLVVTGWNSNINSTNEAVETLFRAYKQRKINFIVS